MLVLRLILLILIYEETGERQITTVIIHRKGGKEVPERENGE